MSGGLAISLSQDSVEILVWTIAKELEAEVRDKDPFTKLLDSIESAKKNTARSPLPLKAKILELNSARVNFKHYGNLPAPGEVEKFVGYAEESLREAMRQFFNVDFDSLSLADLVTDDLVRNKLKLAEQLLAEGSFKESVQASSEAEAFISLQLKRILPEVDWNLKNYARLFQREMRTAAEDLIRYLSDYMNQLRMLGIAGLLNLKPAEYIAFKRIAPHTILMGDLTPRTHFRKTEYSQGEACFCLKYTTNFALTVQHRLGGGSMPI